MDTSLPPKPPGTGGKAKRHETSQVPPGGSLKAPASPHLGTRRPFSEVMLYGASRGADVCCSLNSDTRPCIGHGPQSAKSGSRIDIRASSANAWNPGRNGMMGSGRMVRNKLAPPSSGQRRNEIRTFDVTTSRRRPAYFSCTTRDQRHWAGR